MFQTLRKRLTALYTVTTGIILTFVIVVVIISFSREFKAKNLESFQSSLYTIQNKLQTDSTIQYSWLADYENKNNLLIYIEDKGRPIDYEGYGYQSGLRGELVEKVKSLAAEEEIDLNTPPISSDKLVSQIYSVKGSDKVKYSGAVSILKLEEGYRSVVLLQYYPVGFTSVRNGILMFFVYGLGISALYLVSWKFVGNSLRPVEENRKRQTEFIAAASHELRSPLAVIQTSASALRYKEKEEGFLNNIEKECTRMSKLIDEMLLLASTDAKNWSIHKNHIDTDTLLIETFELLEPLCKKKDYELVIQLPDEPLANIQGDFERLKQVLAILIDNALSYAKAERDKRIVMQAYEKRNYLYINVIDFGTGIEEEKKAYIFDRFYRADEARNDKNHFGLGLSIAKEIIEMHGGILSCDDTTGGGSTFTIKLPRGI
ncbi:sensor histidine kinase [Konateibacter massiliensis]|uniref:sensor histidine kinase n=1 Tax=Konateibacter massiliensis TaxID=2002841 RepID=UPI000C145A3C|nr:HAMP domain-containing sensor histidine kinase [Konateibacter massiliensis]